MTTPTVRAAGPRFDPPRSPQTRRADVERLLRTENHLWLATSGQDGPHLVPLAFGWDGTRLIMMTKPGNRTAANLRADPRARASLGSTRDVVIVDGLVTIGDPADAPAETKALFARLPLNPERVPGVVALWLTPHRIQAWRHFGEMPGRTVMADGTWLA